MGDTYKSFERITKDELMALINEIGCGFADPLLVNQNDGPTIQELLDIHADYKDRMTFSGYTIRLREDYRVSVDGIEFTDLEKDEIIELMGLYYRSSSDAKIDVNTGFLWFWWD